MCSKPTAGSAPSMATSSTSGVSSTVGSTTSLVSTTSVRSAATSGTGASGATSAATSASFARDERPDPRLIRIPDHRQVALDLRSELARLRELSDHGAEEEELLLALRQRLQAVTLVLLDRIPEELNQGLLDRRDVQDRHLLGHLRKRLRLLRLDLKVALAVRLLDFLVKLRGLSLVLADLLLHALLRLLRRALAATAPAGALRAVGALSLGHGSGYEAK